MTNDLVARQLVLELKELRRAGGSLAPRIFGPDTVIGAVFRNRRDVFNEAVFDYLNLAADGRYPEPPNLRSIIGNMWEPEDPDVDLTRRRRGLALKLSIGERTIIRIEDEFIESFAECIASPGFLNAELRGRMDSWLKRTYEEPPPTSLDADDIPGLVRAQGVALQSVMDHLDELRATVGALIKSNQKLAKRIGM